MKKTLIKSIIAAAFILPMFISCGDGIPTDVKLEDNMSVYLLPAMDENTINLFGEVDTTLTLAGLRYGGAQQPVGEITASLAIDPSLIATYNAEKGTSYHPMPSGTVSLDKSSLTIPSNRFASDIFKLSITDRGLLDADSSYLVPIKVSSLNGGLSLDETRSIAYVVINRQPSIADLLEQAAERLKGQWTFDNSADIYAGSPGAPLIPHEDFGAITPISVSGTNKGISIPPGSYLWMDHNIGANGGGIYVNEYTLICDVKANGAAYYAPVYNTNLDNYNEAEIYANGTAFVIYQDEYYGDPVNYYGESKSNSVSPDSWTRLAIAVSLANHSVKLYANGLIIATFNDDDTVFVLDGNWAMDTASVLIHADVYGDYYTALSFAELRVYDKELSAAQIAAIGGVK